MELPFLAHRGRGTPGSCGMDHILKSNGRVFCAGNWTGDDRDEKKKTKGKTKSEFTSTYSVQRLEIDVLHFLVGPIQFLAN